MPLLSEPDLSNPGWLLLAGGTITGLLGAVAKLITLLRKSKEDALGSEEVRRENAWKRHNEMLDDSRSECEDLRTDNARLRQELAECYNRPELDRRLKPRPRR